MYMNAAALLRSTLLLAAGDIFLRGVTLGFQMYLAGKIGSQGLGIFGLISSLYMIFVTISISGIRFCVTRLASEEIAAGNRHPRGLIKAALFYGAFFSAAAALSLFYLSDALSERWIVEKYAALPLRILSFSLPFTMIFSVLDGYFTAKQKIRRSVFIGIFARLTDILCVVLLFKNAALRSHPCDVLTLGTLVGEITAALCALAFYFCGILKKSDSKTVFCYFPRILKVALPLAISAYMRTGLSCAGHMIIPYGLRKAGMGVGGALSTYGLIHQMALPVIMFPAAVLVSLADIIIPRLTHAQVEGGTKSISYISGRCMRVGFMFSMGIFGIMFFYGEFLGKLFFNSFEAGLYIRLLSFVIPIIYCDCVTDCCLKGLGQQLYCMLLNVAEAVINIVMLFFLLPRLAILGYLITMFVKEIFNAFFSLMRLRKLTVLHFDISIFFAGALAVTGARLCALSLSFVPIASAVSYAVFYVLILYALNKFTRSDLRWLYSLIAK